MKKEMLREIINEAKARLAEEYLELKELENILKEAVPPLFKSELKNIARQNRERIGNANKKITFRHPSFKHPITSFEPIQTNMDPSTIMGSFNKKEYESGPKKYYGPYYVGEPLKGKKTIEYTNPEKIHRRALKKMYKDVDIADDPREEKIKDIILKQVKRKSSPYPELDTDSLMRKKLKRPESIKPVIKKENNKQEDYW